MMLRTHLAINILFILLFLPHVTSYYIFLPVALIATLLPDLDTGFSTIGKMKGSRIIQFFVRHRGLFHSFTLCIIISVIFAAFIPLLALPFFLGYSLHLLADSYTFEGIKPFWPLKKSSSWLLRTGSFAETSLFIFFLIADLFVFVLVIKSMT